MTKQERLNLYKEALKVLENGGNYAGLCSLLMCEFRQELWILINDNTLPELYAQRPDIVHTFWWKPYAKEPRIKALREAIKLCKI